MTKRIAVLVADGAEPIETIAPMDAWRRGGIDVESVSIANAYVTLAHEIRIEADAVISDVALEEYDGILIPGGSVGVDNLRACPEVLAAIRQCMDADKFVFAICAGPMVLNDAGVLKGRRVTCYPGCETEFPPGAYIGGSGIAVDGNLVTASGPAFALDFGLACLEVMTGKANADKVAADMLVNRA